MWSSRAKRIVAECRECPYIDKPYIEHHVFELYAPQQLGVLVISESPPPGRKPDFLYNLEHSDRLRRLLAKAFSVPEQEVPRWLSSRGAFWAMAAMCRPPSKGLVKHMASRCRRVLAEIIELAKPRCIAVLGRVAEESYRAISSGLRYRPARVLVDRHPLYVARFERHRLDSYLKALRDLIDECSRL